MRYDVRRTAAVCVITVGLLSTLAGLAAAAAPTKTGWWNAATANGVALPQPTTGADDLHVGQGASGPSAYAAVAYDLTGQAVSAAVLQVKVVPNSAVGTPDLLACPTRDASWRAGGNQPYVARPLYDCAVGVAGIRAADGSTLTFLLDTRQQAAAGGFSLAIVPAQDAAPFSVDLVKPDATSLSPELNQMPEPAPPSEPAPAPFGPAGGDSASGSAPFPSGIEAVSPGMALPAPPVTVPVAPAPMAAPAPVRPPGVDPVAARPRTPVSNRERYQAGTLLALLAGALVWACQQPAPERRLIGGLARTAAQPTPAAVEFRPRGIGRFAQSRTSPARPLL